MIAKVKIIIGILFVAITLGCIGYGVYLYKQNIKLEQEINSLNNELEVKTNMNKVYINSLGQYSTQIKSYKKSLKDFKHSSDSVEKVVYKQLEATKIKLRKVKEALFIATTTTGTAMKDTVYITKVDSILMTIVHYSDKWLNATVYPDSMNYTIEDSLIALRSPVMVLRDFFLWRLLKFKKESEQMFIELTSLNPNSKVKGRLIEVGK